MALIYSYTSVGPVFAGPHAEGQQARLANGSTYSNVKVDPPNGLYEGIPGADAPTIYHVLDSFTLSFEGVEFQASGRVRENNVYVRSSMDSLLATKQVELDSHASFVALQSVRSVGNNNFWISLDIDQRRAISSFNEFLTDRAKDRTIGTDSTANPASIGDPTTYWPRDFPIVLIRDSNGNRIVTPVDEAAWGQVLKDKGGYDVAIRDARVNVNNDFEAAAPTYFADGTELPAEWDALAAIDVTDPSYGWPTYYTGTQSVGVRTWP